MRRSATISRFVLVTTLAAIIAGLIGTTTALARDPGGQGRQLRMDSRPGREAGPERASERVVVRDLPSADASGVFYQPALRRPAPSSPESPSGILVAPEPIPVTTTSEVAATESISFAGVARTDLEPPDPWIAVGPDHVIQAVNTTLRFSDRSGAQLQQVELVDFFDLVFPGYEAVAFDPRVIYDSLHGRWIAITTHFDCETDFADVGTGWIDIAISQSANPMGAWEVLYLGFSEAIPDYPGIGTSTDKVALSSNIFSIVPTPGEGLGCGGGGFLGTELDVMAWSQLVGTGDVNVDFFFSGGDFANNYFTWRPAVQTPATTATVFVVAQSGANDDVAYATITGNPATGTTAMSAIANLTTNNVIADFDLPPPPKQPGTGAPGDPTTIAAAVDERPTDAVWQGSHLAFVSTYPCDPAGGIAELRDCVRVSELATTTAIPTALQDFLISEEGADLYMGGVGFAGNGDLHAVWTRSSADPGDYASSYAAHQLVTDSANRMSAPQLLKAGLGNYDGVRWGDYVGVAQDPQVPNAVWQANQYAPAVGWATHVSQLQTGGSSYVPIPPVRVLDTRPATNVQLTGTFNANTPRTFAVGGFVPSIPANAIAVTGNIAVVSQTSAGYVSITPTPTATPPAATINFPLGDVRANNFTIPLSATGRLAAVYKAPAGKTVHLVIDITGYFLPGDEDATYLTLTPVRVMDTRPLPYHVGPLNAFQANTPQTLSVAGDNGIPANATAVTGNLTVFGQTRAGYVSVTPDVPAGTPPTATMNFPVGDIRGNGLTADLNAAGDLSITYTAPVGATVHAILDITGYYLDDNSGMLFYPLNPGRLLDTRAGVVLSRLTGLFTANTPRTFNAWGHWGIPADAGGVTGNLSIVGQTAAGYATITPNPDPAPPTATINFPLGDVRGNGVTVPLNGSGNMSLVYKAGAGRTTHMILDVTGYFK
jgi:hypothetical protein